VKSVWKSILACVVVMTAGLASAQTFVAFNPPPCDFSDFFYKANGIDPTQLVGRFGDNNGTTRLTGPPATGSGQVNYVADTNCSTNDPTRRNFRLLATTGAFRDDNGGPTEFFSLIAFLLNQTTFETSFSAFEGDNPILISNSANPRGITAQFLVGNFEAYGAPTQKITLNGQTVLAPTPCGSLHDPAVAANDCFPLGEAANGFLAAETPNLRQDWRISSNRNAMDGSDNNCINNTDKNCAKPHLSDSPFGYFCDDLLGMWIVTYFWYTQNSIGGTSSTGSTITPTANCNHVLSCIRNIYGNNLDGTPVFKTGDQLHFVEGVPGTAASVFPGQGVKGACLQDTDLPPATAPCGQEGNLDPGGADGGAIWLICPTIQDPRNGAIATDAFLDAVRNPGGTFLDSGLSANFTCLQQTGKFCNESAPGQ
jgi:hypothetical protein